ncbi:hypothetical protein BJ875DRAFT_183284 [Amylocarpus encephaloides]|uniref:Secreted protein n=1 Tax=Amylocarpus encephaloides TaxID=45428 RepID=A0A9P7Y9J1_9HELO|nr:hypothetical protein BJ875DRAFT_183284 [Amylocarpus encephaloides]
MESCVRYGWQVVLCLLFLLSCFSCFPCFPCFACLACLSCFAILAADVIVHLGMCTSVLHRTEYIYLFDQSGCPQFTETKQAGRSWSASTGEIRWSLGMLKSSLPQPVRIHAGEAEQQLMYFRTYGFWPWAAESRVWASVVVARHAAISPVDVGEEDEGICPLAVTAEVGILKCKGVVSMRCRRADHHVCVVTPNTWWSW